MTGGIMHTPSHTIQFSTYIFSADILPEMLKLGRVTKVKVLFLVQVFVLNFDLFKCSAAILAKGLLSVLKLFGCLLFDAEIVRNSGCLSPQK